MSADPASVPRIVVVAGARPNFMKVAPVLRALRNHHGPIVELVHTGQHYDDGMSTIFFEQLGIPSPDFHLQVGSASHAVQTGRVMAAFEQYLLASTPMPAGVVVVGDVNSTMAATLAAVKLGIRVAHVEAGLRSFDRSMPEEINRVVTDAVADLLLVSEPSGEENLKREGIPAERIHFVGNVMIDTLVHELPAARALDMPARIGLPHGRFAVVTLHRPSNVDDPAALSTLVAFLILVARNVPVIFPVHPRTRARLDEFALTSSLDDQRVHLVEPLAYREMLSLLDQAQFVVTDSGGIQEETTYLGTPCLTARDSTERPVTVTHGTNTLIGRDLQQALVLIEQIKIGTYKRARAIPLWDGNAAERIADTLIDSWVGSARLERSQER